MHCRDSLNINGNLFQSYKSLERAYGEGRIGSIGVCNVNAEELDEISMHSTVSPHAVQSFALVEDLDLDVRTWCFDHHAAYFPLGYQRNANSVSEEGKIILGQMASQHGTTEQLLMTRFFLQTGAIVTPGSTNPTHLIQNVNAESIHLTEAEMRTLGWPRNPPDSHGNEF
jgi:diketogulonate reductase-like aldo/keto reductase